jgi:predicted RNA-binding Zn-ribbon protein involved in translation (DUF1610 family)
MSADTRDGSNASDATTDVPTPTEHSAHTIYGEPYTYFRCPTCGDEWTDARLDCERCS